MSKGAINIFEPFSSNFAARVIFKSCSADSLPHFFQQVPGVIFMLPDQKARVTAVSLITESCDSARLSSKKGYRDKCNPQGFTWVESRLHLSLHPSLDNESRFCN